MGLMNMMIGTKRSRPDSDPFDSITAMANCLMLLSGAGGDQFNLLSNTIDHHHHHHHHHRQHHDVSPSRVFECKTCNRQFPSFQALGGHRASHKKPKLGGDLSLQSHVEASPAKPKTHECSVCGQEFAVGQALGGHMRRHRAVVSESPAAVVGSKNSDNEKRIWGLDLNLTPLENDDLDFGLGKIILNCVS